MRPERIAIVHDLATNCTLVRVALGVHYFHVLARIAEALEGLRAQEAAPSAIWRRDGVLEDILICSGGGRLLSEPNPTVRQQMKKFIR